LVILAFCVTVLPMVGTSTPTQSNSPQSTDASSRLIQRGRSLYEAGQFRAAIEVLQQAAQDYQRQGNPTQQAIALSNLALVYQKLGLLNDATQAMGDSLKLLNALSPSTDRQQVLAQTLELRGSLQLERGQAEPALTSWQQAEAIYTDLSDSAGVVRSQINQAQALQVLGFYRRAFDRLISLNQQLQSQPDTVEKAVELRSLGHAFQLIGEFDRAQQTLQQSLEIAQRLQRSDEASATLLSLGNIARVQQDEPAAIDFYQQATASPILLTRVQAQINLLDILPATHPPAPSTRVTQILTELDQLPLSQSSIYTRIHLAQSLMKHESAPMESIAQLLAKTVEQAHRLGDIRSESYALGVFGHLYERTKQWPEAQRLTEQALWLIQSQNLLDVEYHWHWQLGRILKQQKQLKAANLEYDAAIANLQVIRNDLVSTNRDLQFSFRDSVEPIYRESVELLLENQSESLDEQVLDKARQRIEALQLAELDNFFRQACLNATPVLLDQVVDQDNPTSAIFYPILLPKQLHLIVKIPERNLQHFTINRSQTEVETIVTQLREFIVEPDRTIEVKALAQQLYQWLIQPVDDQLQQSGVNSLVFILDGVLRNIPLAALHDGQQYLIEKYAIALSPGLTLLNPRPLATEPLRVLAAGLVQPPPQFGRFPPLPAIESEFQLIQTAGIDVTELLDQQFTSKTLETEINATPFNVVHLATHGQFSSQAEKTFVLAADGPINVTQLDTLLRRRDQTQASAIELLVLSACQTAAGDNRATLGLAGMAVRAGARSTLASLWNIGDRSTAILIGEFYKELASAQVTKAEALRRAQVTLLKRYPNYSRPSSWAAYVLVGNWL
jgi:CHAT domain-containing protein